MKYNIYYLLFVLLLAVSCGKKDNSGEATNNEQSTEATSNDPSASRMDFKGDRKSDEYIKARVAFIYEHVFAESYNDEEENEIDFQDMPSPDEKYCTKDWNELLAKIYDYDSVNNPDDIGYFDADYWIMGQDGQDLSVSDIEVVKHEGDNAVVGLRLHNSGNSIKVNLDLKYERDDWFIDNFTDVDNNLDWKKDMKDYLKK